MLTGYRVYIGLLLSVLGSFGVFEKAGVTQEEAAKAVDVLVTLIGFGVATYFNWVNHKKMR